VRRVRMRNPALVLPGAVEALQALGKVGAQSVGVPIATTGLVQLRVGIINGWLEPNFVRQFGGVDERQHALVAWRDAPFFTDAERAALALTDAVTRIAGRDDPVPDDVWNEAARYYDEKALASLLICISVMNMWNRLMIPTRQPAGEILTAETVTSRDGTGITVVSRGTGPAVVMVDGPTCSRSFGPSTWFASLLAGDFTVYSYDRRGRGGSGDTAPYSVEREIEDLQAVIEAAGGEDVGVYGMSSGAVLALEAAAAGVTGLGRLVLSEPRLADADGEEDLRPKLSALLAEGRNADAVELFHSSNRVSEEIRIARGSVFWAAVEAVAPTILYDLTISEESSVDRYRSVTVPTLVIDTDTNDRLHGDALTVAGALPNARHHTIPATVAGRPVTAHILDELITFFTT
jgi:pimeloyl-ACP methyl ester carboxylesterase